jgi:hypothetical protein
MIHHGIPLWGMRYEMIRFYTDGLDDHPVFEANTRMIEKQRYFKIETKSPRLP